MARKIVVTSGKGGVGKTSITASLGIAISSKGYSVLMIDADIGLNNLDVVMGLENRIMYDLCDALKNRCTLKQALVQDDKNLNLYILPSQKAFSTENISSAVFKSVLNKLDMMFDYILIDSPAGIDVGFHRAVCGANEAIVVTTSHVSSIRDAAKVISLLNGYNLDSINVIVNRARGDLIEKGEMLSGVQVANILKKFLIGVVPEDDYITILGQVGRIDLNQSKSRKSINLIANYLLSGQLSIYDPTKGYKSLLKRIFTRFGGVYEWEQNSRRENKKVVA